MVWHINITEECLKISEVIPKGEKKAYKFEEWQEAAAEEEEEKKNVGRRKWVKRKTEVTEEIPTIKIQL